MVVVDGFSRLLVITVIAVRFVGVIGVVGIVNVKKSSAVCTENVIVLVTVTAEGVNVVSFHFSPPDPVKTAITECGVLFETVLAHDSFVKFVYICFTEHSSAEVAYIGLGHRLFLLNVKNILVCIRRNDI